MRLRAKPHQRGFTLAEVVVSVAVMAVLMGGLASAVVLASRALPDSGSPLNAKLDGYYAAEQIAGDLFCAQSFLECSATAVEFAVADRTGDDAAETIRYAWSGTAGDPLAREYNGGTAVDVAQDLHEFALTFNTKAVTTTTTQTTKGQSAEIDLASFENWPGIDPLQFLPSSSRWMAEYFQPTFPDGVTTLNITRVQLMMRTGTVNDENATVSVGIHRPVAPGDPQPQSTPIGTPSVRLTTTLEQSYAWADFPFSDVTINDSDTELVIVVKGSVLGTAKVRYYYWKSAPADTTILSLTTDAGGSWDPGASAYDDYDTPFHIWGTYETDTTQEITVSRDFLQSVGITLRIGPGTSTRMTTTVQVLNQPEVTTP